MRSRIAFATSALPATLPAITSPWPFTYFVSEWITTSAPTAAGRSSTGDAKVASTARVAPFAWASFASAPTSVMRSSGFAIASMYRSVVGDSRSAASTLRWSVASTKTIFAPRSRIQRSNSART